MSINRKTVLDTLIKHETLTINDLSKKENLGVTASKEHLGYLLSELMESEHIQTLSGAVPCTYSITDKGIEEGARLDAEQQPVEKK